MFAPLQSAFATALLDPERAIPDGVTSHSARVPEKRFAVYRNNVIAGLVNALRARFPATERIVGDEFFAAMARLFVMAHPPRSKILSEYGDDLPAFIADFPPAAELPYLADVARLEAARTRAYHAADADSAGPQAFAGLAAEQFPALRLRLHPSAHVIRSMHPVVSIWAMNSGERDIGPIDGLPAEDALVSRPRMDVQVRLLPPGAADFLDMLAAGANLATAADAALSSHPDFDLTANLADLISSGLIAGFSLSASFEGSSP